MFRMWIQSALIISTTLGPVSPTAWAIDISIADRVEEDWEVVIADPDEGVISPQLTTIMKSESGSSAPSFIFNLNFRETPDFLAGGLQVKIQSGDQVLASASQKNSTLASLNETITWTQRLSLVNGGTRLKIVSGKSSTWGAFGGDGSDQLAVSTVGYGSSLAGYNPTASARDSGASFGSNRVTKMTLLRVRYYRDDILLSTDSTPRPISLSN